MSKERITDDLLPANFADGDVLYGEDINKIIRILKAASNITKTEIDSILSSEKEFVFRTYEEAVTYSYNNIVEEGQICLILENGLEIYKYIDNIWEKEKSISLLDIFKKLDGFKTKISISKEEPEDKTEGNLWFKIFD